MYKIIILIAIVSFSFYSILDVFAQTESPRLATFQETAQIFYDRQRSNNVTASITLQSTSNQEIRIPSELEQKILANERIIAVVLTNEEQCVLGVVNQACIMINVSRDSSEKGIIAIQDAARAIGNTVIDDINKVFDTNAKAHSVYVHQGDEVDLAIETSGVVSGRGTISAVYTMPLESTDSMYEKISSILIPKEIRDSGGFYNVAKKLSSESGATMTFSMIPIENSFLYQLKVSMDYTNSADVDVIDPLKFLKTDSLQRSNYFSQGFYPLNSILQVVILSEKSTNVNEIKGNIIPTEIINDQKIPTDLSTEGWIFDPESGNFIDGKYLFGKEFSVNKNDLIFSLDSASTKSNPNGSTISDEIIILIIIVIAAGGAAIFFFKGFKKKF